MGKFRQLLVRRLPASTKRAIKRRLRLAPRMSPSVIELTQASSFEVAYRKGTSDVNVLKGSFENDIFFPELPEYVAKPDDIVIDVGAHIGTFSLLAASKAPKGRVFAVEPCQESFNLLRINQALNPLYRLDVSRLALSDKKGTCRLHFDSDNWGHSTVAEFSHLGEEVPCDTLTHFLEAKGIARCQLMKMNCEGAEFPILLSTSPEVLKKFDLLLVLYHCDLYTNATHVDLVKHLEKSGFTCTIRNQTTDRGWIVATR